MWVRMLQKNATRAFGRRLGTSFEWSIVGQVASRARNTLDIFFKHTIVRGMSSDSNWQVASF